MKKIYKILLIVFGILIILGGIYAFVLPALKPEPYKDYHDIICPSVCVPMWILNNDNSCTFIECGSGCSIIDNKTSFATEYQCNNSINN